MPTVSLKIPQIGEGLQEARLVAVLKQPGEPVRRDEPIYQMETDKAVMDVESPYEGTLVSWSAQVDDVLPIGAEVAVMETAEIVLEAPAHGPTPATGSSPRTEAIATATGTQTRRTDLPPRTRAFAKDRGLTDADIAALPEKGRSLVPEDIEEFIASRSGAAHRTAEAGSHYDERPLSARQRLLASRLVRGSQLVVPGTMSLPVDWTSIERARERMRASGGDFQPSSFTVFAYAVAVTLRDFPALRSSLIGDATLRTYHHVDLGIAVGLPNDELVLAVVEEADALDWRAFAERTRTRIDTARGGTDQARDSVTISLTNMQSFGIRDAVPVVVPPSVATLFLGAVYESPAGRVANLSLTFDHRCLNGVGAAQFLQALAQRLTTIDATLD